MTWSRILLLAACALGSLGLVAADDPPRTSGKAATKARPRARKPAADAAKFRYRGLSIDIAALWSPEQLEALLPTLRRQVDITVEAKVKPEIAEFFRTVPVTLGEVPGGGPGFCFGKSVVMVAQPLPPDRVVLLHELLHAYHSSLKPDEKKQITRFYQQAARLYPFPPSEYFLTNQNEFFAVTASIYLHGEIPRPPHTCAAIRSAQPEYHQFLAGLFDPTPAQDKPPQP